MLPLRKTAILTTGLALMVIAGLVFGWLAADRAQGDTPAQSTPERIAGYEVLGVRNSDNTTCYPGAAPLVILKTSAPTQESLLSSNAPNMDAIQRGLQDAGFPEGTSIGMAGPGITAEMESSGRSKWNSQREANGCIQFGGGHRDTAESGTSGDVASFPNLNPGYSVIVDSEIGPYTDHNAQSVILEAPAIGDSQSNFSAFLNNGFTNSARGNLLQNGLLFDGAYGSVVWTDEARGLSPIRYSMSYQVGHDYYFTISYTNDLWWLCASNRTEGASTYECFKSPYTEGTRLWGGDNTSVWFENQNSSYTLV